MNKNHNNVAVLQLSEETETQSGKGGMYMEKNSEGGVGKWIKETEKKKQSP